MKLARPLLAYTLGVSFTHPDSHVHKLLTICRIVAQKISKSCTKDAKIFGEAPLFQKISLITYHAYLVCILRILLATDSSHNFSGTNWLANWVNYNWRAPTKVPDHYRYDTKRVYKEVWMLTPLVTIFYSVILPPLSVDSPLFFLDILLHGWMVYWK